MFFDRNLRCWLLFAVFLAGIPSLGWARCDLIFQQEKNIKGLREVLSYQSTPENLWEKAEPQLRREVEKVFTDLRDDLIDWGHEQPQTEVKKRRVVTEASELFLEFLKKHPSIDLTSGNFSSVRGQLEAGFVPNEHLRLIRELMPAFLVMVRAHDQSLLDFVHPQILKLYRMKKESEKTVARETKQPAAQNEKVRKEDRVSFRPEDSLTAMAIVKLLRENQGGEYTHGRSSPRRMEMDREFIEGEFGYVSRGMRNLRTEVFAGRERYSDAKRVVETIDALEQSVIRLRTITHLLHFYFRRHDLYSRIVPDVELAKLILVAEGRFSEFKVNWAGEHNILSELVEIGKIDGESHFRDLPATRQISEVVTQVENYWMYLRQSAEEFGIYDLTSRGGRVSTVSQLKRKIESKSLVYTEEYVRELDGGRNPWIRKELEKLDQAPRSSREN